MHRVWFREFAVGIVEQAEASGPSMSPENRSDKREEGKGQRSPGATTWRDDFLLLVELASRLSPSGTLPHQNSGSKRWPMPGDRPDRLVNRADEGSKAKRAARHRGVI